MNEPNTEKQDEPKYKMTKNHVSTFVLVWLAYAFVYFLRKPIGLVKKDLQMEMGLSVQALGWLDLSLFLPFAAVSLFFGNIGDKLGPRMTLGCGLIVASIANALISVCANVSQIMVLLFISGAAQSLGWPASCKIIFQWFPSSVRNKVFGFYGTCCSFGGVMANIVTVYIISQSNWRTAFVIQSCVVFLMGILVLLLTKAPKRKPSSIFNVNVKTIITDSGKRTSFFEIWKIPTVPEISIAMLFIKCLRYAILMWLPLFFVHIQKYSEEVAGLVSTSFEIGAIFGTLLSGIIADKYFKYELLLLCSISCMGSAAAFLLSMLTTTFSVVNFLFIATAGFLLSLPDIFLTGPIAASIGEPIGSISAVVGVINGMGSVGCVVEGPLVGYLNSYFGLRYFIHFVTFLPIIPAILCGIAHLTSTKT